MRQFTRKIQDTKQTGEGFRARDTFRQIKMAQRKKKTHYIALQNPKNWPSNVA